MSDPELTREEAIALADNFALLLYRAQDRVAFVREMLASRTEPVEPATVLAWLDHQHCPCAESEQQQIARLTARVAELERHTGRVTDHTFEGEPIPGQRCGADLFGQRCGAAWERHALRDDCQHLDTKRLSHRPADLALVCACGAEVFPGLRTTPDSPKEQA